MLLEKIRLLISQAKRELSIILPSKNEGISSVASKPSSTLKIKMPNSDEFVELGHDQIKRIYEDPIGARLLVVIDESAELLKPSGVKNKEGKEEDQLKQEMAMIIQSLAQLGRSAGVHLIICTQRAEVAAIAGGNTRENSLALDTKVIVKNG